MKNTKGFTLVEVLISVTILALLAVILYQIFTNIFTTNKKLELQEIVHTQVREVLQSITEDTQRFGNPTTTNLDQTGEVLRINGNIHYHYFNADASGLCNEGTDTGCYISRVDDTNNTTEQLTDEKLIISTFDAEVFGTHQTQLTNEDTPTKLVLTMHAQLDPEVGAAFREAQQDFAVELQTTITQAPYIK